MVSKLKKVAFFDLDDTLLDHTGAQRKALLIAHKRFFPQVKFAEFEAVWVEITNKYWKRFSLGQISVEEVRIRRTIEIWNHFGSKLSEKEALKIVEKHLELYEANWKPLPDVKNLLSLLQKRGLKLGIITNGHWKQQIKKLKKLGIYSYFDKDLIIVSGEIGFAKPDPKVFLHAQKVAEVEVSEILYFGNDYEHDVKPSLMLGWETIHVTSPKVYKDWFLLAKI